MSLNLGAVTRTWVIPHKKKKKKKKKCPTVGEQLICVYTEVNFKVDEGKGWLNPSRDKN